MFTTIDELLMYSFTNNYMPLLKMVQNNKVKKIHLRDDTDKIIGIELHKDSFKDIDFDQFLNDMMLTKLDYVIKIIGKRIFIMIHYK